MTVKQWQHSDTLIYNGSSPIAWTDLDLTAVGVPASRVFAALEATITSAAEYLSFRPGDDTGDYYNNAALGHGTATAKPNSAGPYSALILVVSDTSGVVEWIAGSAQATQITLLGYIQLEYSGSTLLSPATFPITWTSLGTTLSDIVGVNPALSFFRLEQTSGTQNEVALRKAGASENYLQVGTGIGGANQSATINNKVSLCLSNTSNIGTCDVKADFLPPGGTLKLHSYEPGTNEGSFYNSGASAFSSVAPTTWSQLDLGTIVGDKRAFVILSITRDSTSSGTIIGYGFRPNGSSSDYLDPALAEPYGAGMCAIDASETQIVCVETDSQGIVEWKASGFILGIVDVDVQGFFSINTPPTFSEKSPTGDQEDQGVYIEFSVADDDETDLSTLNVVLTDPGLATHNVIINGVFQGSYNGTITANDDNGYDVVIDSHPAFNVGLWQVDVDSEDDQGKKGSDSWTFTVDDTPKPPPWLEVFKAILPPWLLRTEGTKLIGGIADVIDDHRDRLVAGVKLRFPGLYSLEGIDRIGKERRLRRGPTESADVFADRLRRWWEDHRLRGNAYALLEQMQAYFTGTLSPPYDVVSYRGLRHIMDASGNITRDSISWGTDGSGNWAQVWIFLYFASGPPVTDIDTYSSIVKDWIPAHVDGQLVIIHPGTRLWDYPQPVPDWDDTWDWSEEPTIEDL